MKFRSDFADRPPAKAGVQREFANMSKNYFVYMASQMTSLKGFSNIKTALLKGLPKSML